MSCGSNLPFSEWVSIIPHPRQVEAIVDRLRFNARIIERGRSHTGCERPSDQVPEDTAYETCAFIVVRRYHRLMSMRVSPDTETVQRACALFRGLADPTRLAILLQLQVGERRVVDLVEALALPQSTVSSHLACLRDCQLVESRPVGRQSFYRLAATELLGVFEAAEALLARTGDAVSLCPRYGDGASR